MDAITKKVLITDLSHDLSTISFINTEKFSTVDELETLKRWLSAGEVLTLTITKESND